MRGIKIPQYEFALKMPGGLMREGGGGGVFAGHYSICALSIILDLLMSLQHII